MTPQVGSRSPDRCLNWVVDLTSAGRGPEHLRSSMIAPACDEQLPQGYSLNAFSSTRGAVGWMFLKLAGTARGAPILPQHQRSRPRENRASSTPPRGIRPVAFAKMSGCEIRYSFSENRAGWRPIDPFGRVTAGTVDDESLEVSKCSA